MSTYAWSHGCTLPSERQGLAIALTRAGVTSQADSAAVRAVLALCEATQSGRLTFPALREAYEQVLEDSRKRREQRSRAGAASGEARRRLRESVNCALSSVPRTPVQRAFNERSDPGGDMHAALHSSITPSARIPRFEHAEQAFGVRPSPDGRGTVARIDGSAGMTVARAVEAAIGEYARTWIQGRLALATWPWAEPKDRSLPRWAVDRAQRAAGVTPELVAYLLARVDDEKPKNPAAWMVEAMGIGKRPHKPWSVPIAYGPEFTAWWAANEADKQRLYVEQSRLRAVRELSRATGGIA